MAWTVLAGDPSNVKAWKTRPNQSKKSGATSSSNTRIFALLRMHITFGPKVQCLKLSLFVAGEVFVHPYLFDASRLLLARPAPCTSDANTQWFSGLLCAAPSPSHI